MAPLIKFVRSAGQTWPALRFTGAVAFAGLVGFEMSDRRGPVLGALAFLVYGVLLSAYALSMSRVRRWSAEHPVVDATVVAPLSFFALLLVPGLPWWAAAVIAVAFAGVFVTVTLYRRRSN
ncbi:hypothetical protein ACQEVZ_28830 [Dactylosporangium sp. CA-152071]|uniref:hypothetical protein n=1 Tax=Dactylosporangium sp. CA-152071 TaxID=3239933 RepID=UPI003D8E75DC